MENILRLWKNFKICPDLWFFFGFLLTFTLSTRKILISYPIKDAFNEYTAISIYLSDIFLFLAIFSWILSILCNKYILLSNNSPTTPKLSTEKVNKWLKCSTFIPLIVPRGTISLEWNIFKDKFGRNFFFS